MIDVILLGTGGMMPLPGRALTSLYVRHEGKVILIDCGEGTQTAIRSAGLRFKPIDGILITHFHADHISGLPGLLLTLGNEGRTERLRMYGPVGLERIVNSLRAIVPELPFEIQFHPFSEEKDRTFSCAGLHVTAIPLDHGIPCYGYRVKLDRPGRFDPQAAKAKGIPVPLWGRLQRGESVDGYRPEDVLGAPRKGLSLVYATDTRPVDGIREAALETDLLILEGMFGEPEKLARAENSRHMMMSEAAAIACAAKAKELWLTHFSPATPEPEIYQDAVREVFANTVIAVDGQSKTLFFPE